MDPQVDPEALELAGHEASRTVEETVHVLERLQFRLDGVLKLGIAETAGLIAVFTLLSQDAPTISVPAFVLLVFGVVVSFVRMGFAVHALGGVRIRQWLEVGAPPGVLRLRLVEPTFDKVSLQWALLRLRQDQVDSMRQKAGRLSTGLSIGTSAILLSGLFYLLSLALIVGSRY